ncbi:MAG: hypothetical protein GXX83_10945 [Gaiellales bacterium]|nr:hypothetical protein [Gaiellales bacterium]
MMVNVKVTCRCAYLVCPDCGSVVRLQEEHVMDLGSMSTEDRARVARALCSCYVRSMTTLGAAGLLGRLLSLSPEHAVEQSSGSSQAAVTVLQS